MYAYATPLLEIHSRLLIIVKSIRPLIETVEHVRRELAWGLSTLRSKSRTSRSNHHPTSPTPSHPSSPHVSIRRLGSPGTPTSTSVIQPPLPSHVKFTSAIEAPALGLGHAIIAAMQAVELLIGVTFDQDSKSSQSGASARVSSQGSRGGSVRYALRVAEQTLMVSRNEARERLGRIFDEMDLEQRTYGMHAHYPKEVLDGSLIMIALLQVGVFSLDPDILNELLRHIADGSRDALCAPDRRACVHPI